MENKYLKTLQVLAKIGKVLSRIAFIASIVGMVLCLTGLGCLLAGFTDAFKIGGVTIHSLIANNADVSTNTMYVALALAFLGCLAEMFVAGTAIRYFKHELETGTPFTMAMARELKQLGIITIVIPCVAVVVEQVVYEVMRHGLTDVTKMQLNSTASIGLGIGFLLAAALCRYGAFLRGEK